MVSSIHSIFLNHVGFPCLAPKRFIMKNPPVTHFQVESCIHCNYTVEFEGEMTPISEDLWQGDFTSLQKPCDYRIRVGEEYSRFFVIDDSAYSMAKRLMLSYYTLQRCGSPLGWAGLCHQEDGYIAETGERVDLRGGYHQSCDLRKSPGGVTIGVLALMRWALLEKPLWDQGAIADEVKWACDYYLKTVQPNGCVYNTLNAPLEWDGRLFYASGAPDNAQWNTLMILALGAVYFAEDAHYAKRLTDKALRIWHYMNRPERTSVPYTHPDILPRGMDAETFFADSFKDSAADLCSRLSAAVALYRIAGDVTFEKEIVETANRICDHVITGNPEDNPAVGALRLTFEDGRLLGCSGSYGWLPAGLNALCDACDVLPMALDRDRWSKAIEANADLRLRMARKDPWLRAGLLASEDNLAMPTGHPAPGRPAAHVGDSFKDAREWGFVEAPQGQLPCVMRFANSPSLLAENALFLRRAARLLRKEEYLTVAQANLDQVLGCNEFDMSSVECVGYNQPCLPVFGQYFPSTPKIPGAIYHSGAGELNRYSLTRGEYDMPAVGMFMWALAEMGIRPEYAVRTMMQQHENTWGRK